MLYIFDWDGTLCDSLALISESIRASSQQLGLPVLSDQERKSIIGLGLSEAVSKLYPDLPSEGVESMVQAYRNNYISLSRQAPTQLYNGVEDVLDELKIRGHTLAVATGKSRAGLERVLTELNMHHYFAHSRCCDETRSKPHPLMLNEILQESGMAPESAVMIGDTDFDLLMAKAASILAVGVSYGAHPIARLRKTEPDYIIEQLSELPALNVFSANQN